MIVKLREMSSLKQLMIDYGLNLDAEDDDRDDHTKFNKTNTTMTTKTTITATSNIKHNQVSNITSCLVNCKC